MSAFSTSVKYANYPGKIFLEKKVFMKSSRKVHRNNFVVVVFLICILNLVLLTGIFKDDQLNNVHFVSNY